MLIRKMLLGLVGLLAWGAAVPSFAASMVTYSWTTTSVGFGTTVGQPSLATFQVALSKVQTGSFAAEDITNITLAYPGLTFDAFTPSSGGLANAAYVNPVTGALVYNNIDQGLSVIGYQGGLFSESFLSITIGNPYSPFGTPLIAVSDQFNALKNGSPIAGFPTAGFWTAVLPETSSAVPEPATWVMMISGFGLVGLALRRRRIAVRFA